MNDYDNCGRLLVEICFYRIMFQWIFILVKYVSSILDILDTFYTLNLSYISLVSREYYVLRCYKLDVINMTL